MSKDQAEPGAAVAEETGGPKAETEAFPSMDPAQELALLRRLSLRAQMNRLYGLIHDNVAFAVSQGVSDETIQAYLTGLRIIAIRPAIRPVKGVTT